MSQPSKTDQTAASGVSVVIRRLRVERWRRRRAEREEAALQAVVAVMSWSRCVMHGIPTAKDIQQTVTLEKARSAREKRELMNDLRAGREAVKRLADEMRARQAAEREMRAATRDRDRLAREAAEAAKRAKEVIQRQGQQLIDGTGFHDGLVLLEMARVLLSGVEPPSEEWRQTAVDWYRAYDRAVQITAGTVAG